MFIKPLPCQNGHIEEYCFSQLKIFMVKFLLVHFSKIVKLDCVTLAESWFWAALAALQCSDPFLPEGSAVWILNIFRGPLLSFNKKALWNYCCMANLLPAVSICMLLMDNTARKV